MPSATEQTSPSDPTVLELCRQRYEYARNAWLDIRNEAEKDMRFVSGDPWDEDDKKQRKNRPTIAPDELAQYRNQVINQLRMNPRGMKFTPKGNGATDDGARFYQNKAREVEYRSHGKIAYITAAENAIQRSYGYVSLGIRYPAPRAINQEIFIDAFPNPDMVLPDPDAVLPTSLDMQFCFELQWIEQHEFKVRYKDAKFTNFADGAAAPDWIKGTKVLTAIYWTIETRKRKLMLVTPPPVPGQPPQPPKTLFDDELAKMPPHSSVQFIRDVDYPTVRRYLTNGLEILHAQDWPGRYIPIISCYGPIYWVTQGGTVSRTIMSMTRAGRDPWKAYCYACSQELEILGQVPKASVIAAEGQLAGHEKDWEEAAHVPKAFLLYKARVEGFGDALPPPQRLAYTQHEHLNAIEIVKEGYRRAVQAAMGSNFLPTNAQRRNEKSGVALDKIDQSASTGTFHFIDHYDDMIQAVGVVFEDLCDKVHDYAGETAVMDEELKASVVPINSQGENAVTTQGDYLVTVSTGPSSDSERDAVEAFIDRIVGNLQEIAAIAGPQAAKQILARSIRLRNGGPIMDQIADLLDPQPKTPDGKPVPPELLAAQSKIQELTQVLQRASMEKQAKVIEQQGKYHIATMQEQAETIRHREDNETKLAVAELNAKIDRLALFLEESRLVGARRHEHGQAVQDRVHTAIENTKDRVHERLVQEADQAHQQAIAAQQHDQALQQADQQGQIASEQMTQQAALQPPGAGE